MWGSPGKDDKPKVTLKVRSVRALKKYAQEPKCLRCGYDLRGQIMADRDACPECGQACRFEGLADQISGQRVERLPVVKEVRAGVMVALGLPVIWIIMVGLFQVILIALSFYRNWQTDALAALLCVAWLVSVVYTAIIAYKAFNSWRGVLLWFMSYVYAILVITALVPMLGWIGLLIAEIIIFLSEESANSRSNFRFTLVWPHVVFIGAVALMYANQWWSGKWIVTPCRIRCRALALEYLQDAHDGQLPPPAKLKL